MEEAVGAQDEKLWPVGARELGLYLREGGAQGSGE